MSGENICPQCHPIMDCPKCAHNQFLIYFENQDRKIEKIYCFECCECENKIWVIGRMKEKSDKRTGYARL